MRSNFFSLLLLRSILGDSTVLDFKFASSQFLGFSGLPFIWRSALYIFGMFIQGFHLCSLRSLFRGPITFSSIVYLVDVTI